MVKKILKEINEMRKMMGLSLISEQDNPGTSKGSSPRGGTGAANAGSYISAGAFDPGGILTKSGRKKDRGELPEVVDITGGETGTFQTVDVNVPQDNISTRASEQQKKEDDRNVPKSISTIPNPAYTLPGRTDDGEQPNPYDDDNGDRPRKDRDPREKGHNKNVRRAECCKKCKNGKFSNVCDDKADERGCVYATISDCQLAKR